MPQADNTEDTSVSEDTSTNEETPDTEDTTDLEDSDLSFDDGDDDDTEETDDSSEDEETDTEPAESEEESEEDEEPEEESKDDPESSDEETKEEDTPSKEDIKRNNQEQAARRIAEKQAREQAKAQQQQDYLQAAEDDRDLALRQLQVDAYNNRVEQVSNKLENGIERAVASIDLFRTGTPAVKEELARRLDDFERMHVQYDSNGDPVNVTGDVYQYLQTEADSIQRILNTGARTQTKAKNKAKARTDTLPTRAPKEPKVDPDLAAFDEEVAKWS